MIKAQEQATLAAQQQLVLIAQAQADANANLTSMVEAVAKAVKAMPGGD